MACVLVMTFVAQLLNTEEEQHLAGQKFFLVQFLLLNRSHKQRLGEK